MTHRTRPWPVLWLTAVLLAIGAGCQSGRPPARQVAKGAPPPRTIPVTVGKEGDAYLVEKGRPVTLEIRGGAFKKGTHFRWMKKDAEGWTYFTDTTAPELYIPSMDENAVGTYACEIHEFVVEQGSKTDSHVPTVSLSAPVELFAFYYPSPRGTTLRVIGMPYTTSGTLAGCGSYAGYFVFKGETSWGLKPVPGEPEYSARDPGNARMVSYTGINGSRDCATPKVLVNPVNASQYRFAVYFPTTPLPPTYEIELKGFRK